MNIIDFIRREYNSKHSCCKIIVKLIIFVLVVALLILYSYFCTFIFGLVKPECHEDSNTCIPGGIALTTMTLFGIISLFAIGFTCKAYCDHRSYEEQRKLIDELYENYE